MVRNDDDGEGHGGSRTDDRGRRAPEPAGRPGRRRCGRRTVHELTWSEACDRARTLRRELAHHERRGRVRGSAEIPDAVYDALKRELAAVERRRGELSATDGRRPEVGLAPEDGLGGVRPGHPTPGRSADRGTAADPVPSRSRDRIECPDARLPGPAPLGPASG